MKDKIELVKAWIKKAENDLIAARYLITIKPNSPLDAVCFHAQQSAENYFKAYLTYKEVEFPKTHDLGELIVLASKIDGSFADLIDIGEKLTDYAVDIRCPLLVEEPTLEEAKEAIEIVEEIKKFVLERLKVSKGDRKV
ncbi:HEPN domain-containing protein [Desulfurobacterium sp.]|uniref:HEPN domain-containing protein n=1 Tax=Desulfurobacterium sp. TaxID=2004706 RepID=UPI00260B1E38|nr:HEPN domain-containing protein [Desulfurobacterium sp.]